MLDAAFIRANLEAVKSNCKNRNLVADVDKVIVIDDERKKLLSNIQAIQQKQNELSKLIPKEKDPTIKQQLVGEGKSLREQANAMEAQAREIESNLKSVLNIIPNMTHPDAPVGLLAEDNKEIKHWGQPRKFDFTPKDHVALCDSLQLADFEAGASVAGQKFYYLKNEGALLELALVQYAMNTLVQEGFIPVITPDLARVEVLEGIGFIPRDPDPEKRQVYTIADTDLCLVATAEITLGGMHRDQVLDEANMPLRYAGLSHCFRTEAGAFCTPEQAEDIHLDILRIEEKIFQGLGLCYRVIDTCTGDLGGPAYRKYDLEAWMPGRGKDGDYGEVTSTSNCTDYQSRRLNIRSKSQGQKGTRFAYTLNGTAVAVTRAIVAILENNQQADGSVIIPEVLRPMIGKDRIVPR
jgi:seryl-tRNA synthetase